MPQRTQATRSATRAGIKTMRDWSIYYSTGNEAEISSATMLRALCLIKCKALLHKNTQKENSDVRLLLMKTAMFANYYPISCEQPASSSARPLCCCGSGRCRSSAGVLDLDETAGCVRQSQRRMIALQRAQEQKWGRRQEEAKQMTQTHQETRTNATARCWMERRPNQS